MNPYAWAWDREALVLVPALSLGYALVLRRFPTSRARVAAFAAGGLLLLAVSITPLQTLALHYLLSAHLLQNVVFAEWAPALLVLGIPPLLAREFSVPPLLALPLWLGNYYAWHIPAVYDFALRHQYSVLHLEHGCYVATGVLVWWPIVHGRIATGAKALYTFAAFALASPLGLLLALIPRAVYDFYVEAPRVWSLSPLADQQLAGATMAAEQAVVFFAVFAVLFLRFLREEQAAGLTAAPRP